MPWQVQVALNIPPFPHRPGMHHIDGAPPEPDGRPGTFTMLAGVLISDQPAECWRQPVEALMGFGLGASPDQRAAEVRIDEELHGRDAGNQ